jgi:hypothetical protein
MEVNLPNDSCRGFFADAIRRRAHAPKWEFILPKPPVLQAQAEQMR